MSILKRLDYVTRVATGAFLWAAWPVWAATFVVNSTGDLPDANQGDGTCYEGTDTCGPDGNSPCCTLRAAIQEANATPNAPPEIPDAIYFCLDAGMETITPMSTLPAIEEAVEIDGTTQALCSAALRVELDGGAIDQSTSTGCRDAGEYAILCLKSSSSIVRGLVINGGGAEFHGGGNFGLVGVWLLDGGNHTIVGNYIGTNVNGVMARGNDTGIRVNSSNNSIGGSNASQRNIISGNGGHAGIYLNGPGNHVLGNFIGTNMMGTGALGNAGAMLIEGDGNLIGETEGTTPGGACTGACNLISGNGPGLGNIGGIYLNGSNANIIQGNFIGVNVDGTSALGNSSTGILVQNATGTLIGGLVPEARNLIAGNSGEGIRIDGESATCTFDMITCNTVQGNYIGTDHMGEFAIGNGSNGVQILGASRNLIGGENPSPSGPCTGPCNLISGNANANISICGSSSPGCPDTPGVASGNRIFGNFIGTNADGTQSLEPGQGVDIVDSPANLVGGVGLGEGNLISPKGTGVQLRRPGAIGNIVVANLIGTNAAGNDILPHTDANGVKVFEGASNNIIGGIDPGAGNVIAGLKHGVFMTGEGTTDNIVQGNFIGTDRSGGVDLGNTDSGVNIQDMASGNRIGGTEDTMAGGCTGACNVIAFNDGNGVRVSGEGMCANAPEGITIRANSIHSNDGIGIENVDCGNNEDELSPPIVTAINPASGTACPNCCVDVYSDNENEGAFYEGSAQADGAGNWEFLDQLQGPMITATATDADCNTNTGNTSEFSVAVMLAICGNGTRELGEQCDPPGPCCSATCLFEAATTECRGSAGLCDVAESCTGSSADCPPDAFDLGTECRASAGVCDPAEVCDGSSPDCPPNAFDNGTECRASAGVCDVAEFCTGSGADCPPNAFDTATECRASAGVCDPAEACDGSSPDCPVNTLGAGNECRASAGVCDPGDNCDGISPECPPDVLLTSVCRESAGVCDLAESCDGVNPNCPADAFGSGNVCRAVAGDCDVAESCMGTGPDCPPDIFDDSMECRPAQDVCDVSEACTGNGLDCPSNGFAAADTLCRASTGDCDPAENCDGNTASCPADVVITACISGDGCCPEGCADDSDCVMPPIPTVSEWGLLVMGLLLLTGIKIKFSRRRFGGVSA